VPAKRGRGMKMNVRVCDTFIQHAALKPARRRKGKKHNREQFDPKLINCDLVLINCDQLPNCCLEHADIPAYSVSSNSNAK
jgi:hypothetical protein